MRQPVTGISVACTVSKNFFYLNLRCRPRRYLLCTMSSLRQLHWLHQKRWPPSTEAETHYCEWLCNDSTFLCEMIAKHQCDMCGSRMRIVSPLASISFREQAIMGSTQCQEEPLAAAFRAQVQDSPLLLIVVEMSLVQQQHGVALQAHDLQH